MMWMDSFRGETKQTGGSAAEDNLAGSHSCLLFGGVLLNSHPLLFTTKNNKTYNQKHTVSERHDRRPWINLSLAAALQKPVVILASRFAV